MKVLHVCTSRSWGGMEMIVCRLARLQRDAGHQVAFACDARAPIRGACGENGVATIDVRCDLAGMLRLRREIAAARPDIVHVQYSRDLNIAVPSNIGKAGRIVLTKQIESVVVKRDPWHRLLYAGVSRATGISTMIRDNLIATTPLQPGQVDLVHLGIDTGRFRPDAAARAETRRELGLAEGTLAIGMMGRMSPGKGFDDFLEMAAGLGTPKAFFVLIGGHSRNEDDYGVRVEQRAADILAGRVALTGYREDRQRWLNALDIFVFPSHAESFGLALVEAMATGLPCVAYGKDGVLDIVRDGDDGLLARPRDVADLRARTDQLIADAELRARLGRAARRTAAERFSEQRMLAGTLRCYEAALA
ncbi:glycosyltransferase family 1 protein [bacterium]|nr:glycosyltransferase family 1 protein [bacterium]